MVGFGHTATTSVQFAQAGPTGREIKQQLHDGPLTAAIQPHKIPREIHRGALPEIGEDFPDGCFTRGRTVSVRSRTYGRDLDRD